ncbi:MAG: cytochrome c [Ignavibacteria bacterium]|jgi:mono/diheme cytochrome c family protein
MEKRRFEYELNFEQVIKNPVRLFGWMFPVFIFLLLVIGVRYYKNVGTMELQHQPPVNDSLYAFKDVAMKKGGVIPPVDLSLIKEPAQEFLGKGKDLFDANCSSCHGTEGNGDGAAGANLNPAPRNFHTQEGWTNGRKFIDMYKTLQEGIIQNGMAAYEYLIPEDRVAIINYVRTFAEFPEVTDEDIKELDAVYNLSKEKVEQNQIPVKLAMKKLNKEFGNEVHNKLVEFWTGSLNEPGAQLLIYNSDDPGNIVKTIFYTGINLSKEEFIESVSLDPQPLGFNVGVFSLSGNEWDILYNYLSEIANLRN